MYYFQLNYQLVCIKLGFVLDVCKIVLIFGLKI